MDEFVRMRTEADASYVNDFRETSKPNHEKPFVANPQSSLNLELAEKT
jgi:hypothetical protein